MSLKPLTKTLHNRISADRNLYVAYTSAINLMVDRVQQVSQSDKPRLRPDEIAGHMQSIEKGIVDRAVIENIRVNYAYVEDVVAQPARHRLLPQIEKRLLGIYDDLRKSHYAQKQEHTSATIVQAEPVTDISGRSAIRPPVLQHALRMGRERG